MTCRRWCSTPLLRRIRNGLTPGALEDFAGWAKQAGQGTAFGKALVQRYRAFLEEKGLAPSSINVRLAALRKLATEAADNGLLDPAVASAVKEQQKSASTSRPTMFEGPSPNSPTKAKFLSTRSSLALGHESIQTTERYLGVEQDLINVRWSIWG